MKLLGDENALLKQQLENNDRIQRNFEEDLKGKEESLKQKEEQHLQKKEHADEINNDLNEDIINIICKVTSNQSRRDQYFIEERS